MPTSSGTISTPLTPVLRGKGPGVRGAVFPGEEPLTPDPSPRYSGARGGGKGPAGLPWVGRPAATVKGLSANLGYLRDLVRYMERLGWEPYASDHEDGTAQFELNWKYSDVVLSDWNLEPKLSKGQFVFKKPANAKQIELAGRLKQEIE